MGYTYIDRLDCILIGEVILPSASKTHIVESHVPCDSYLQISRIMAAYFPEAIHAKFFRRELECTIGFDQEEIQLSLISLWKSS